MIKPIGKLFYTNVNIYTYRTILNYMADEYHEKNEENRFHPSIHPPYKNFQGKKRPVLASVFGIELS